MAGADAMRVSDGERDAVLDRLRDALVEGRITQVEFADRTDATLTARTVGDLRPLTSDLPPGPPRPLVAQRQSAPGHGPRLVPACRTGPVGLVGTLSRGWLPVFVACTAVWLVTGAAGSFWPIWLLVWAAFGLRRHGHP